MVFTRPRWLLWIAVTAAAAACDLNPQPALPVAESSDPGTAGRASGGSASGGSLNLGTGGTTASVDMGSGVPVIGNGGNASGEAPEPGTGGAGEGGEGSTDNAGAAGQAGAAGVVEGMGP